MKSILKYPILSLMLITVCSYSSLYAYDLVSFSNGEYSQQSTEAVGQDTATEAPIAAAIPGYSEDSPLAPPSDSDALTNGFPSPCYGDSNSHFCPGTPIGPAIPISVPPPPTQPTQVGNPISITPTPTIPPGFCTQGPGNSAQCPSTGPIGPTYVITQPSQPTAPTNGPVYYLPPQPPTPGDDVTNPDVIGCRIDPILGLVCYS